ncbi:MAG: M18 family aminopeptidase [Erysipelotrichaceae bacterium]|nr:M18 family aminopeptidase [Erysipelotrichaceae bacterium]
MNNARDCLTFIDASLSCFHAAKEIASRLEEAGYQFLKEQDTWELVKGGKYYTTRNQSSVIAFNVGQQVDKPVFQMSASHSDSPTFKVKPNALIQRGGTVKLNVEAYGGMLMSTWFDRPLSLAGRVMVKTDNGFVSRLFEKKDCCMIPNVAIHLNRTANDGQKYNVQVDLLPILTLNQKEFDWSTYLANELNVEKDQILGFDLVLANGDEGKLWGINEEFITSARLDDLECAYGTLKGFLEAENSKRINVYCCFDNEEVGSRTRQGADSTLLSSVLERICDSLGFTSSQRMQGITESFMVSADNAQGFHPNHPEKSDEVNQVKLNEGVVVKFNAAQSYTSDSVSACVMKLVAQKAGVPLQIYTNRSDQRGGGTLGNVSNSHVSVMSVDIGLAQWAMHSCVETAGAHDIEHLIQLMKTYYSTSLKISDDQITLEN